jgi:hypothetical protein
MRRFFLSYTGVSLDWLVFIGILMLVCLAIGIFVVWYTVLRKPGRKRKRRHHHRRRRSPTLADLGGLPPRREEKDTDSSPPS